MQKTTKVSVEYGSLKKELNCELFVGLSISQEPTGHACEQLIAGTSNMEGVFSAIRMLKKLEDQLYEILPVPRELAELKLTMEESLQKAVEKKATDDNRESKESDDSFLSALKFMLESRDDGNNPLKKFFEEFKRSESGDRKNGF